MVDIIENPVTLKLWCFGFRQWMSSVTSSLHTHLYNIFDLLYPASRGPIKTPGTPLYNTFKISYILLQGSCENAKGTFIQHVQDLLYLASGFLWKRQREFPHTKWSHTTHNHPYSSALSSLYSLAVLKSRVLQHNPIIWRRISFSVA